MNRRPAHHDNSAPIARGLFYLINSSYTRPIKEKEAMCMADTRSMLFAQLGDRAALDQVDRKALATSYWNVVEEGFEPVDVPHVVNTLGRGESLFIDKLSTLGATQEAVIEALEVLVVQHHIRVFVLDGRQLVEIRSEVVRLMQDFRRLDVVLINRAA